METESDWASDRNAEVSGKMVSSRRLVVTPLLIGANIAVFVAMLADGASVIAPRTEPFVAWGANYGLKTMNGEWWRLLTCMFLHFGILHLGFNMWVLWDFGRLVEPLLGKTSFALLYLVSGLLASVASLAWHPTAVAAGASGAVFGVVGALLGSLTYRRDYFPADALRGLRNSTLAFLMYNVIFGLVREGVDMAAHVGGLLAGICLGLLLSHPFVGRSFARRTVGNFYAGLLGAAAIVIGIGFLPHNLAELERLPKTEEKLLGIYNSAVQNVKTGAITGDEFAEIVERDVIPQWRDTRDRLETLSTLPEPQKTIIGLYRKYMDARLKSWELRVAGIRAGVLGLAKLAEAQKQDEAAAQFIREIEAAAGK
jgi:rhomboid protease GluP